MQVSLTSLPTGLRWSRLTDMLVKNSNHPTNKSNTRSLRSLRSRAGVKLLGNNKFGLFFGCADTANIAQCRCNRFYFIQYITGQAAWTRTRQWLVDVMMLLGGCSAVYKGRRTDGPWWCTWIGTLPRTQSVNYSSKLSDILYIYYRGVLLCITQIDMTGRLEARTAVWDWCRIFGKSVSSKVMGILGVIVVSEALWIWHVLSTVRHYEVSARSTETVYVY